MKSEGLCTLASWCVRSLCKSAHKKQEGEAGWGSFVSVKQCTVEQLTALLRARTHINAVHNKITALSSSACHSLLFVSSFNPNIVQYYMLQLTAHAEPAHSTLLLLQMFVAQKRADWLSLVLLLGCWKPMKSLLWGAGSLWIEWDLPLLGNTELQTQIQRNLMSGQVTILSKCLHMFFFLLLLIDSSIRRSFCVCEVKFKSYSKTTIPHLNAIYCSR